MPFFSPKKEEKTRLFRALSSLLVQRYNIFRRNPNRVNTSQHSLRPQFAAICSRRGLRGVILRGAHEKCWQASAQGWEVAEGRVAWGYFFSRYSTCCFPTQNVSSTLVRYAHLPQAMRSLGLQSVRGKSSAAPPL